MKNITSDKPQPAWAFKTMQGRMATSAKGCCLLAILLLSMIWNTTSRVYAGGGGENMLLVVNPNDEPSLRIANAYVKARNIPINNILYIQCPSLSITGSTFTSLYQTPILAAIAARGLTNQIDYIGTLGEPQYISDAGDSFIDCLNHLTQLQNGMTCNQVIYRISELLQNPPVINSTSYAYAPGSNTAIYHSQKRIPTGVSGTATTVQWYMSGMIGYCGLRGLNTSQAIATLQRTVKSDGTNPLGTIYFEDSQETRTAARSGWWPPIQSYMDNISLPWIQELGITPKNRPDVRGAVVGSATPALATLFANGSAYLPGSWADDLTSHGGNYISDAGQTKVSNFLMAGAAGAAGTVTEPLADQSRFTYASIFLFSNDGSTLGEAYYKSVTKPDLLMFQGDLLSQAYADIPEVKFIGGPADGATVSSTIYVSGSARLNNPRIATGISQLKLFVDGLQSGASVSGSTCSIGLNTTGLTDGIHEVRIVAYNNSKAASEGYTLKNLIVNNNGQSVSITGTNNYSATWNQTLSIPVTAIQGTGPTITGLQLQSLGRTVGSISGLSGNVSLSGTNLAYGNNTIVPVAILSSGTQQVQGKPITVARQFLKLPGKSPTSLAKRNPGLDFYYFTNGAAATNSTLDNINFNAMPTITQHSTTSSITPGDTLSPASTNMPEAYHSGSAYASKLALMIKSNFTIATAGEYMFSQDFRSYTSAGLYIDGTLILRQDGWNGTTWTATGTLPSLYLLPGEHTITIKLGQSGSQTSWGAGFALLLRGPDGNTIPTDATNFYTVTKRVSP